MLRLFFYPSYVLTGIYILAAVLPAFFLLRYIYKKDTVEKEPPGLIVKLLLGGVLAALASIVLEGIGQSLLDTAVSPYEPAYYIILAFLVVAVVEEGTKFLFLRLFSWNDPNFNYLFDAVVYSVAVSLGFAAFENVKYVFSYGVSVALPRAVLSIPAHLGFAVFMGVFFGRAKLCQVRGDHGGMVKNLIIGYAAAVGLHGFYDACAMIGGTLATVLFIAFVIVMYIVVFRLIKTASYYDRPIY